MTDPLDPGLTAWLAAYAIGLTASRDHAGSVGEGCVHSLVSAADGDCAQLEAARRLLGQMEVVDYNLRADSYELVDQAADSCQCPELIIGNLQQQGDNPCQQ